MRVYSAIDDDGYDGFSGGKWRNSRFLLRNAILENILNTAAVKYAIELGLNFSYDHVLRKPS